eukprot:TRINITY_DN1677_c0_g1_i1.p1 TRINITY_DN1677_c0_g1~~TRINITY_DN1677_c0_g1_i1.p1  ORF type:complete len:586 (+),score=131.95 TRINITY_DN1677_c0_g1_i1:44-1801(+)
MTGLIAALCLLLLVPIHAQPLWDQTQSPSDFLGFSFSAPLVNNSFGSLSLILADDFEVPENSQWNISDIVFRGQTSGEYWRFTNYTLVIYENEKGDGLVGGADIPGAAIYSTFTPGAGEDNPEFQLSLDLKPGKYWVSCQGIARTSTVLNTAFGILLQNSTNTKTRGSSYVIKDRVGYFEEPAPSSVYRNRWVPITYGTAFPTGTAIARHTTDLSFTIYGTNTIVSTMEPSSNNNARNIGIGVAIGAFVLIVIVVVIVVVLVKRKKKPMQASVLPVVARNTHSKEERISMEAFKSQIINYSDLHVENELGRGDFGIVFKGKWRGGVVAVKQISGNFKAQEIENFKGEALVMTKLRPHSNVVQFLGITSEPLCIVTEFLEGGSLFSVLASDRNIDMRMVRMWIEGIAAGMLHLHSEGVFHRDLAARNVLLTEGNQAKIADFGMSRAGSGVSHTKANTGPIKWMAPESIRERVYSVYTDVWSFGVTIWEILCRDEPYPDLDPVQVAIQVVNGDLRLSAPSYAPKFLGNLMEMCFFTVPNQRPDFNILVKKLKNSTAEDWQLNVKGQRESLQSNRHRSSQRHTYTGLQ